MSNENNEALKNLLSKVNEVYNQEKALKDDRRRRGELFNTFTVLGLWSEEVRLHSSFIAALLDPKADHGCGSDFLKAFCTECDVSFSDVGFICEHAIISVEFNAGRIDNDYTEGGRIDILIEQFDKQKAIVIENKVYAGDQQNQLSRYKNYCEKSANYPDWKILYLTPDGHEPSEFSSGSKEIKEAYWSCISYGVHIIAWLSECVKIAAQKPIVRESIVQYLSLIKMIMGQDMETETKDKVVNILAETDMNIIKSIEDNLNEAKIKIFNTKLTPLLLEFAKMNGYDLLIENENLSNQWPSFTFEKKSWKKFNFLCECEVSRSHVYPYLSIRKLISHELSHEEENFFIGKNKYNAKINDNIIWKYFDSPYYELNTDAFIRIQEKPVEFANIIIEKLVELTPIIDEAEELFK